MTYRDTLRPHVTGELDAARAAWKRGDRASAWQHLERAHILSQPSAWLHTRVHGSMLVAAVRAGDLRELVGQLVRLAVAGVGSAAGRYPLGNTGRARVPLTAPMPVPPELAVTLEQARQRR